MTRAQAAKILRQHNAWRRDGEGERLDPKLVGQAIDVAVEGLAPKRKKWRNLKVGEVVKNGDETRRYFGEWTHCRETIGRTYSKEVSEFFEVRRPLKGGRK